MRLASPGRLRAPRLRPWSPAACSPRPTFRAALGTPSVRRRFRRDRRSRLTSARPRRPVQADAQRFGALGSLYHTYPHGTTKEAGAKRGAGLAYSAVWSE
nr:transmembrane protein 14C isoform X3 [Vulpes vulpes]